MPDISQFFVAQALAQTAAETATPPGGAGTSVFMNFLPLVLIFAVFYILLIRPQQKKMEQHNTMLKSLRRGDRVVTGGGIVGTINKLEGDEYLIVEIADGIQVKVLRSTITSLSAKPVPVTANDDDAGKAAS